MATKYSNNFDRRACTEAPEYDYDENEDYDLDNLDDEEGEV
jgi:hypothetical protein